MPPKRQIWLLMQLLPVMLVLTVLFGGALLLGVAQALGFAPWFGVNTFPDTSHFAALWSDPVFWRSLGFTLYYAFVATGLAVVFGVLLALALRESFAGKTLFKYIYKLPLMIPYAVGIALAVLLLGNGGMASRMMAFVGVIDDPSQFPQILKTHAGWGIIAVYVWKQLPFVALTVYAVLLGLGRETEEAAKVLGANRWQVFWHVTLPQILPAIVSSSLIITAFNIGAFEAPFILGGGFPDTLPVVAWRYFNDADYTLQLRGMAVVVTLAIVSGVVLFAYLGTYRRFERKRGRS
ncbi:ABC transporter permease [Epibacterium ulvae]|uniref:ABC transporter permease n=1 Tax=Epibacterium ulvae TaxID=1156985 RepID=UPI0024939CAF|nr:sugar ABC transporter permease [Epibacterium ulvae]